MTYLEVEKLYFVSHGKTKNNSLRLMGDDRRCIMYKVQITYFHTTQNLYTLKKKNTKIIAYICKRKLISHST